MSIADAQAALVADFRSWADAHVAGLTESGAPVRTDREDGSTLTTRYPVAEALYIEVTVRPHLPQIRVGVATDDRWKSEEIEEGIQSSGDTMGEYLEVALAEAGLDWVDPPVEHYRDQGVWFSFITPVDLETLDACAESPTRSKIASLISGYLDSYAKL